MSHINVTWLKYSFIPEILLEILRETLLFSSPEKWMTAGVFCSKSFISLSSVVLGGWFISFLFVVSLNRFCCRVQMLHAGQFIPFTLPTILTSNNHYYLFPVMVIPMKQTALDYKRAVMVIWWASGFTFVERRVKRFERYLEPHVFAKDTAVMFSWQLKRSLDP